MKRSEALKKLKHFMSYQNPYDDRDIEDQILDYCERIIEMLPPPSYVNIISLDAENGFIGEIAYKIPQDKYGQFNFWEEE